MAVEELKLPAFEASDLERVMSTLFFANSRTFLISGLTPFIFYISGQFGSRIISQGR